VNRDVPVHGPTGIAADDFEKILKMGLGWKYVSLDAQAVAVDDAPSASKIAPLKLRMLQRKSVAVVVDVDFFRGLEARGMEPLQNIVPCHSGPGLRG